MYTEQEVNKLKQQRDRAEAVVDQLKSMLGIEEAWSNHYGYEEFLEEARVKITSPPEEESEECGICTHCGFPRKIPGEPYELCHIV